MVVSCFLNSYFSPKLHQLKLLYFGASIRIIYYDLFGDNMKTVRLSDIEKELSVSRWTLYTWIKTGKLIAFKLSCGHYRVPLEEVQRIQLEAIEASVKSDNIYEDNN